MRLTARLDRTRLDGAAKEVTRDARYQMEAAALIATEQGGRLAVRSIRDAMQGAGLARLGNAIGGSSDLTRGAGVHRGAGAGFSASAVVFVRSKSARTLGAIDSYTRGAQIRPTRGRWLWIPTDDVARVAGGKGQRERVTPGNWSALGFDTKVGPLVYVRAISGHPMLVVKNVGVSAAGKARSAKSLTKRGAPRKGQRGREFLVAFVGIPGTSRAARIDVPAIVRSVSDQLPALFAAALRRT